MSTATIEQSYIDLITKHAQVAFIKIRKPTIYNIEDLINEGITLLLEVKKEKRYDENRNCSFKTFFIMILRNYFRDLIVKSYRKSKSFADSNQKNGYETHLQRKSEKEDPVNLSNTNILLDSFTAEEKEYAQKMITSLGNSMNKRRNETRETLQISKNCEERIRRNILIKIQK